MQNKVKNFNEKIKDIHPPMPTFARLLDIQSELGELSKEYLKITNYGTENFVADEHFKDEFGDCLYALLSLAEETGIDSNECLEISLQKLKNRIEKTTNLGSQR